MDEFRKLGLTEDVVKVLEKKGFTTPTHIQSQVIPLLLKGEKDVVGQSQTGTGKTASFGLPILARIKQHSKTVRAIVLTPTRELAIQVAKEIESLRGNSKATVLAVYGGSQIEPQIKQLKRGVDIVVGTPGRVMDLQRRRALKLDNIEYFVLDEADEMLNMGFIEDIELILEQAPEEKKMLLFSATMPRAILNIAKKYMREYEFIEVEAADVITETVEQIYYDINAKDRVEGIRRVVDFHVDFYGIIFCNTKASVDTLTQQLLKYNYSVAALHGDITQSQREKILSQFRNKNINILIATDVAARGIDVENLTHVINFSLPQSPESYVHRIGRTGRAGKKGIAITFVMPSEKRRLGFVERINKCKLEKRELPTGPEIIAHKEDQIKVVLQRILDSNKGKITKFHTLAKELLKEQTPEDVIAAVLKYAFNNQLEASIYKSLSKVSPSSGSTNDRGGSRRRDGRRPRRRDSRSDGNHSRDSSRSDRSQRSGSRDTKRSFAKSFSEFSSKSGSGSSRSKQKFKKNKSKRD